jgi:hypothetical protein
MQPIHHIFFPRSIQLITPTTPFSEHNVDLGLNYKRTFTKEDEELEINVNSSFGKNHINSGNTQFLASAGFFILCNKQCESW